MDRSVDVVDLACGTGKRGAGRRVRGARVTAVDITPELIEIGAEKADRAGRVVTWVTADAADTGLPSGSFDAAVSNMGIIFVEPVAQVAEIARLLKPAGVLGFSSWVRGPGNPFFDPIVEVLGPPPIVGRTRQTSGAIPDTIADRLPTDFDDVDRRIRCPHVAIRFPRRRHVFVTARIADARAMYRTHRR